MKCSSGHEFHVVFAIVLQKVFCVGISLRFLDALCLVA